VPRSSTWATALPGSPEHPRGYLFEVFPRLLDVEVGRRHTVAGVIAALERGGCTGMSTTSLWEVRRRYAAREDYLAEVAARTGRSILHEVDDAEIGRLVIELRRRLSQGPLVEPDRRTIWSATRP
jgi:hypothetical protein